MFNIHKIIAWFDFDKVHKCMVALDWKWVTGTGRGICVPDIDELKICAIELLKQSVEENISCGMGGFHVYKTKNELRLVFEVAEGYTDREIRPYE